MVNNCVKITAHQKKILCYLLSVKPKDTFEITVNCEKMFTAISNDCKNAIRNNLYRESTKQPWIFDIEINGKVVSPYKITQLDENKRKILVEYNKEFCFYNFNMTKGFICIQLGDIKNLKTYGAIKLVELTEKYRKMKEAKLNIEKLKELFGCKSLNTSSFLRNFKRWYNEIKEREQLNYQLIYRWKKVIGIKFIIGGKHNEIQNRD